MAKHSKQYIAKTELVEKDKPYELEEAVAVLKQSATAKFDEPVELHIKTGADPRHAFTDIHEYAAVAFPCHHRRTSRPHS